VPVTTVPKPAIEKTRSRRALLQNPIERGQQLGQTGAHASRDGHDRRVLQNRSLQSRLHVGLHQLQPIGLHQIDLG
jgi:hypothetical protein